MDTDIHCAASILVSRSLKLLPPRLLVVSYADSGRGHLGIIYQASNFIYCGARKSHDQEYIINGKSVHARTLTGKISNPRTWAKANNIQTIATADKHRYVFPTGNKRDRRYILSLLKWERRPYPKGKSRRYDAGEKLSESETSLAKPVDPQGELF